MMEQKNLQQLVQQFVADAVVEKSIPFGNGHINDTYKVELENGETYLLQRVNHNVFKDVQGMMNNIQQVTKHIGIIFSR